MQDGQGDRVMDDLKGKTAIVTEVVAELLRTGELRRRFPDEVIRDLMALAWWDWDHAALRAALGCAHGQYPFRRAFDEDNRLPSAVMVQGGHEPGCDKFRGVYPEIDWEVQLDHAEKIGLGRRQYQLILLQPKHEKW